MIKRLIFDVDGTLIAGTNFKPYIEKALKMYNVCSTENVDRLLYVVYTYESKYDNYNEKDFLHHLNENLDFQITDELLATIFEELRMCVPPRNQKLIDTIDSLSKKYELVLLTNFFKKSQLDRLNNMEIGKYFIDVFGEEKIKPNPESYLSACGLHKACECVMIGDNSELDIKGAKKVGLHTIYVNSQNVKEDTADVSINRVEDIDEELIESIV